jgi:hypothetical protein
MKNLILKISFTLAAVTLAMPFITFSLIIGKRAIVSTASTNEGLFLISLALVWVVTTIVRSYTSPTTTV